MNIDDSFVKKYDGLIHDRIEKAKLPPSVYDDIKGKVYERIMTSNSYDPQKGKVSTWVWNICRSVISNEVKKHGRSKDALDYHPMSLEDASNIIGNEDAGTAEDEIIRIMEGADVLPRDKQIMVDYHLHGASTDHLSQQHNLSVRAVEQILYRTLKALRSYVSTEQPPTNKGT